MILNELLPAALQSGIQEATFFKMTPAAIKRAIEAFWDRQKNVLEQAEYNAWLTGYYTMYAIGCNLSKKTKYPKNPIQKESMVVADMEVAEDEKEKYTEMWMNKLLLMSSKHNRAGGS